MNEFQLSVESLEDRLLLSGNVVEGFDKLFVYGTTGEDFIEVRQINDQLR